MVTHFHGQTLPEPGTPVGYAWLIDTYDLKIPMPPQIMVIANRHRPGRAEGWILLSRRIQVTPTLEGHLSLALQHEGLNLSALERLFNVVPMNRISELIIKQPNGFNKRRLWFVYEWLTGRRLNIEDLGKIRYIPLVDPGIHYGLADGETSSRQKIRNNLPGTQQFCPMVRRTSVLDALLASNLARAARRVAGQVPEDLMRRAAAFMLFDDTRASFAIENEKPDPAQGTRWARAISEAGRNSLSVEELNRLQGIVIGNARFVRLGLRQEEGFIGSHDRETTTPIPVHISARHNDLPDLLSGLIAFEDRAGKSKFDPILTAAILAFGFVYIHPYADGNGRLHRYLFHHVLAAADFNPPGIVFPISAAILRNINGYNQVLRSRSVPLLPFVDWSPDAKGNVLVTGETAHHYRFFDATEHAVFLAGCVRATIEEDLPREVAFLKACDEFKNGLTEIIEMPNKHIELLRKFLHQNEGSLSRRALEGEFSSLTEKEVKLIETLYFNCWRGD
ncbi:MAG: Fic family protein [Cohaesibacteraceae bacterium]|nr:Fic family protein [Cohaesibacteraceae bacterium]MBL4875418.1 Fic family protein [Cohaesibacteraceae bacterium]